MSVGVNCRRIGDLVALAGLALANDRFAVGLRVAVVVDAADRDGLTFGVVFGVERGVPRLLFSLRAGIVLRRGLSSKTGDGNSIVVLFNTDVTFFKCSTRRVGLFI